MIIVFIKVVAIIASLFVCWLIVQHNKVKSFRKTMAAGQACFIYIDDVKTHGRIYQMYGNGEVRIQFISKGNMPCMIMEERGSVYPA